MIVILRVLILASLTLVVLYLLLALFRSRRIFSRRIRDLLDDE